MHDDQINEDNSGKRKSDGKQAMADFKAAWERKP